MAIVMVMFMMNPAGLNPMVMVHQNRVAAIAGVVAFLALAAVGSPASSRTGRQPTRPRQPSSWERSCWATRCSSSRRPA